MAKEEHPLKKWMRESGYGKDYERVARELATGVTGESIRLVANGYRTPGWELAFALEAKTKISAHDLRDDKLYPNTNGRAA